MKTIFNVSWIPLIACILLFSCKKEAAKNPAGKASIKVIVSGSEFAEPPPSSKANNFIAGDHASESQVRNLPLGKDLWLRVELVPTRKSIESPSLKAGTKAAIEQDVANGVKYKLVVYDNSGTYVTERDYTRGDEGNAEQLALDGGKSYTFIAYSINSTANNPNITFSDPANKTLSTSSISGLDGTDDFMYFKKELTLEGNSENYLSVIFNHSFSKIVTTIDATSVNKNITEAEASINSHFPNADVQLSDASITRTGSAESKQLNFSGINTQIATANNILNGSTSTASLHISKLTVGTLTRTDLAPINNLTITPGIQYKLNLTITDTDAFMMHQGQKAAKIGGLIWMRHNLGADTSLNPDQSPSVRALIGNYYQFGRAAVVATSNTGNGAIAGWNTNKAADGSWNSGTASAPVKTANAPCPSGYRIPTRSEWESLINSTNASNMGTWATSDTQNSIGSAKILSSKTNPNVKLTYPSTGYRNASDGVLYWRGGGAGYWTVDVTGNNIIRFYTSQNNYGINTGDSGEPDNIAKTMGMTIRCISIQR